MFQLTYRSTPQLMRRLYFREVWRAEGGWLLSACLVLGVGVWSSVYPDYWWFGGCAVGASITYLALVYTSYRRQRMHWIARDVRATVTDQGLQFDYGAIKSDISWATIAEVRKTPDGLLLTMRLSRNVSILPQAALSFEAVDFIVTQVREHGGRTSDGA